MKIEAPVSEVFDGARQKGKYLPIWEAAMKLEKGQWLPVTCATKDETPRLRAAANFHRTLRFTVKVRGVTVFVQFQGPRP